MSKAKKQIIGRRDKITQANSTVFVAVSIAAVLIMVSLISVRFLWNQMKYNNKVIGAKTESLENINTNLANLDTLKEQFPTLEQSPTANAKTILHALPPSYDYAGLATSVEFLVRTAGVKSSGGVGEDISASAVASATVSSPVEIPIVLEVEGNYNTIRTFVSDLERSIRPFHVTSIRYSGTIANLTASITAVTYYQPARSLGVTRETIQ